MIACASLLAINDSLPYVGLRDDSCQTMFSGLEWSERSNNHFFVPQHALSDVWSYVDVRDVRIEPAPGERRLRFVAEWLERPDRRRNTEALRVAIDQLCAEGHRVGLEVRPSHRALEEPFVHHADACRVASLSAPHRWLPVRVYETDLPALELGEPMVDP